MHNLIFVYLSIWAIILGRLGFDEWQQKRASKMAPAAMEDRKSEVEYATWKTATT
jgi:hypothetical protein